MSPKRHRKCFTKARVTGDSQGSSWCFCVHRRAVTATIARGWAPGLGPFMSEGVCHPHEQET